METLKDAMRPNAHREREKVKATITGMIASLNQKLVAAGKPPVLAPAKTAEDWESAQKYARRVTVPTKVPLDPTELQKINDLCVAEAKALAKFEKIVSEMQILDEEGPAPDVFRHFTAEEQAAMLEAMRKRLHGDTDQVLEICQNNRLYLKAPPQCRGMLSDANAEALLEDWVKARGPPNDAELLMLARYLKMNVWLIYEWFCCRGLERRDVLRFKQALGIPFTRYRGAGVQTKWHRLLARLRKEAKEARGDQDTGKDQEETVTMKDVSPEMHPFIDQDMD